MWAQTTKNGVCFTERYKDLSGKYRTVSCSRPKDTPKYRREAAAELNARIEKAIRSIGDFYLSDLIKAYIADQKLTVKASTVMRNEATAARLLRMLGDQKLESLSAGYIRTCLIDTGKGPGTLNEYLKRFKAMIRWGYANDMISSTACIDKLHNFKDVPHRSKIADKYLERQELSVLLKNMKNDYWRLLTQFLALSGLRIGEAIALNDEDVCRTEIIVNKTYEVQPGIITTPKTASSIRNVAIQPELRDTISELRKMTRTRKILTGSRSKLFLINEKGNHIEYPAYRKYFAAETEKAIGRRLTPHALRHTHASLLLEQGVPIDTISRRLGHENSRITKEIYAHVTQKLKEKDAEMISKVLILN